MVGECERGEIKGCVTTRASLSFVPHCFVEEFRMM